MQLENIKYKYKNKILVNYTSIPIEFLINCYSNKLPHLNKIFGVIFEDDEFNDYNTLINNTFYEINELIKKYYNIEFIVAKDSYGNYIGYCIIGFDNILHELEINLVYVSSKFRKDNIANNFIEIAVELGKYLKVRKIRVKTLGSYNHLVKMYEKFGFKLNDSYVDYIAIANGEEPFKELTLNMFN